MKNFWIVSLLGLAFVTATASASSEIFINNETQEKDFCRDWLDKDQLAANTWAMSIVVKAFPMKTYKTSPHLRLELQQIPKGEVTKEDVLQVAIVLDRSFTNVFLGKHKISKASAIHSIASAIYNEKELCELANIVNAQYRF